MGTETYSDPVFFGNSAVSSKCGVGGMSRQRFNELMSFDGISVTEVARMSQS